MKKVLALAILCALLLAGCKSVSAAVRPDSAPKQPTASVPVPPAAPVEDPEPESEPEAVDALAACGNYRADLRSAYDAYQLANPALTPQEVVAQVNLGLTRPFYTEIVTVAEPDDLLVLCNKYRALPKDYEPSDLTALTAGYAVSGRTVYLRKEAAAAFEEMCAAAKAEGYTILGQSGYRSYNYQQTLYSNYSARDGQAQADTYSARPGHSEHQTGLAIDVRNAALSYTSFGKTAEYQWMNENSYRYGYVLHYLPGKQSVTGYQTEEWHYRYVGRETAAKIRESGLTLDEYWALYVDKPSV